MKTDKADKTDKVPSTLQQRQADNQVAQDKIAAEIKELSRSAPASRSAAQNERLQALETERQALVKEAATLADDLAKA